VRLTEVIGSLILVLFLPGLAVEVMADDEPWIITDAVVLTEPTELGHVIVLSGGSLIVRDLPEPGLRVSGHIWVLGDGHVRLEGSIIQFMSVFHGQYSLLGEILSLENSRVWMERTTIDGTGGFFGARDTSRITATDCHFTCIIEATQESTIELHSSIVDPYPLDPTGAFTRFGAYDDGRLFADQTGVVTTPALDGRGLIAVSYIHEPPQTPPVGNVTLVGSIAQFSLDPEVAAGSWRLEASGRDGGVPVHLGGGTVYIEDDVLGTWSNANPVLDYRLQANLTDGLGRTLVGNIVVPGSGPSVR
jgi:hypothetical protein